MLLTPDAPRDFLGTIALIALLSVAYGMVMRVCARPWMGRGLLGLLFGLAAILALSDPVVVAPGLLVDMRNLPILLAGAFLGAEGAVAALMAGLAMRYGLGGAGMPAGCCGMLLAAGAGVLWDRRTARKGPRGLPAMMRLATLSLPSLLAIVVLLPPDLAWRFAAALPFLVPLQILGAILVGSLLERERVLLEERRSLSRLGEEDALTGLLNRRGVANAVARHLDGAAPGTAVLLLDLDHFKRINDAHGHAAGDAILQAIGPRLRAVLRPGDILGRFGGEELVAFLPAIAPRGAEAMAHLLCEAVRKASFALPGGVELPVTASVGGAWAEGATSLKALTARADAALYAAKRAGRDCCRFERDVLRERLGAPRPREAFRPRLAPAAEEGAPGGPAPSLRAVA